MFLCILFTTFGAACGPQEVAQVGNLIDAKASDTNAEQDVGWETLSELDAGVPDGDIEPLPRTPTERVLEHLNELRVTTGQPALRENPLLTQAAQNHAAYLLAHPEGLEAGQDPHLESPDSPLFTGLKVQQRVESLGYEGRSLGENIALRSTVESALQSWLETLYSRLPLMDLALDEVGLGVAGANDERVFVLVAGSLADPSAPKPISSKAMQVFPSEGLKKVRVEWNGNELPQPSAPPLGYPSGPVISLHSAEVPFEEVAGVLEDETGKTLEVTSFSLASDSNLPPGVAAIIPHAPLAPNSTFNIRWSGTQSGTPFEKTHSFTTGPVVCNAIGQDCGYGRACYVQQGKGVCLWAGSGTENEFCQYVNDCASGFGCYGIHDEQRCRRYCAMSGAQNCDQVCLDQYSALDDQGDTGFCWSLNKE